MINQWRVTISNSVMYEDDKIPPKEEPYAHVLCITVPALNVEDAIKRAKNLMANSSSWTASTAERIVYSSGRD